MRVTASGQVGFGPESGPCAAFSQAGAAVSPASLSLNTCAGSAVDVGYKKANQTYFESSRDVLRVVRRDLSERLAHQKAGRGHPAPRARAVLCEQVIYHDRVRHARWYGAIADGRYVEGGARVVSHISAPTMLYGGPIDGHVARRDEEPMSEHRRLRDIISGLPGLLSVALGVPSMAKVLCDALSSLMAPLIHHGAEEAARLMKATRVVMTPGDDFKRPQIRSHLNQGKLDLERRPLTCPEPRWRRVRVEGLRQGARLACKKATLDETHGLGSECGLK